jgi:hypothetical protein
MNEIVPFHGVSLATAGRRPDIRALVKHLTAPYSAAEPFEDLIETVRKNSTPARRSNNQRPSAAIAIRNAVAGHTGAVRKAVEYLSVVMLAPDEEDVRQILGAMMMAFHAQPTQTSGFFIDTLSAIAAQCCRSNPLKGVAKTLVRQTSSPGPTPRFWKHSIGTVAKGSKR